MIQDITPKRFNNQYAAKSAQKSDFILCYDGSSVLCKVAGEMIELPRIGDTGLEDGSFTYLFSIDEENYFLPDKPLKQLPNGFSFEKTAILRTAFPRYQCFAAFEGYHLYMWYNDNRLCSRCGERLSHDSRERMLKCPACGNMVYPRINPGVIVAVINGDKLLMSKYAGREFTNFALIAGFTEIGETLEQTVEREVMEEVGLKVKNITFYKSQPWAFSSSLLCGFFAELDGSEQITLQEDELSMAGWYTAGEIELKPDLMSLTREMMMRFKNGEHPFAKKQAE